MPELWYTEKKNRRYGEAGKGVFTVRKGGITMKKSMKKVLPMLLIAAFVTLVMNYDENERILED